MVVRTRSQENKGKDFLPPMAKSQDTILLWLKGCVKEVTEEKERIIAEVRAAGS